MAEAEALIRRMDLEARSLQNPSVKTPLLTKLRDYKAELQRLKRESQVAAKAASTAVGDNGQEAQQQKKKSKNIRAKKPFIFAVLICEKVTFTAFIFAVEGVYSVRGLRARAVTHS